MGIELKYIILFIVVLIISGITFLTAILGMLRSNRTLVPTNVNTNEDKSSFSFSSTIMLIVVIISFYGASIDTIKDFKSLLFGGDKGKVENLLKELRDYDEDFNSYQIPSNQLVENNEGNYYLIDLKNMKNNQILKFGKGEYIINSLNKDFGTSINKFLVNYDFLKEQGYNPKIFILGSADILGDLTFSSKFDPLNQYMNIAYYPKKSSNMFSNQITSINIDEPFGNSSLPLLRAAYLKDILKNPYGYDSEILEGEVTVEVTSKDRNVNLILYVEDK